MTETSGPCFPLGQLVITPGALAVLTQKDISTAISRHVRGDWGDLDEADRLENELSLREGFRVLSAYPSVAGVKFWVITEADRSSTTVLLPEEY